MTDAIKDANQSRTTKGKPEPTVFTLPVTRSGELVDNKGELQAFGGSKSDKWNDVILTQTVNALWLVSDKEARAKQMQGAAGALMGIGPKDDLEGMVAAQLVAAHNAAMECYRRAMISGQTFEGRREEMSQANKLSRTFTTLLEGLNRHRGKGQQKVTVEHVHVHEGGQAIVGAVNHQGGGMRAENEDQPHAIAHAPSETLPSEIETIGEAVPRGSR